MSRGVRNLPALVIMLGLTFASLSGCYRVQVSSGLPPADPPPSHDYSWRHGYLFGLITEETDLELSRVCPLGWAQLNEQGDLLTGTATIATLGLYAPRRVTIVCADGTVPPRAPLFGYDSPLVSESYPAEELGAPPPPPPPLRPSPAAPPQD